MGCKSSASTNVLMARYKDNSFKVTVKTLNGKEIVLPDLQTFHEIQHVKDLYAKQTGIPWENLRLLYNSVERPNEETLE